MCLQVRGGSLVTVFGRGFQNVEHLRCKFDSGGAGPSKNTAGFVSVLLCPTLHACVFVLLCLALFVLLCLALFVLLCLTLHACVFVLICLALPVCLCVYLLPV